MDSVFVTFGFGPIGAGLFTLEALETRAFQRVVVAEVLPELVAAVRAADGYFAVNIADADRLRIARAGPVTMRRVTEPEEAAALIADLAEASEITTALPSIAFYGSGSPSVADLLAAAADRKAKDARLPAAVVYCAENHNHAAEHLEGLVAQRRRTTGDGRMEFLNTVIGKMSRMVGDAAELEACGLEPIAPGLPRGFLVESFRAILVSRPRRSDIQRRLTVFAEKDDLLPFEEAKLYGHNALHALTGFLAIERGFPFMTDACRDPHIAAVALGAMIEESGEALCRKYAGQDPLFTAPGWRHYAEDLWQRMGNPFLRDAVERVVRDPERKLGWNDRIVGTMRLALAHGIAPERYALGAAAALRHIGAQTPVDARRRLEDLWKSESPDPAEAERIMAWILPRVPRGAFGNRSA